MRNVILIGKVKDLRKWEDGFRTHGEFLKSQSVISPAQFSTPEDGDEVAILLQVGDLDHYLKTMGSPETAAAMANDGFDKDSVKFFVLYKDFQF